MLRGNGVDQFLNQDRFSYARAAEQADLTTLGVGGQQVDNLDARFQHLYHGALVREGRRLPVDGPALPGYVAFVVDSLAHHAE